MKQLSVFLSLATVWTLGGCQHVPPEHNQRESCESAEVTLKDGDFNVQLKRYQGQTPSRKIVLILPPTGGETYLDRDLARKLCRAGFDVDIVNDWSGDDEKADDLRLHDRLYTRNLRALSLVIKPRTEGFVGLFGTSLGATYVTVAMSHLSRVDAAFAIVGGAPIPGVIVNSDQGAMKKLREARFKNLGFKDDADYLEHLMPEFPLDPFKSAPIFKGKRLGLIISTEDTTVPTEFQYRLRDLWQPSVTYEIQSGHFWTILRAWWSHDRDIVQFFVDAAK